MSRRPTQAELDELEARLGDAAEDLGRHAGALDAHVGKWVGRAKAVLWLVAATVIGLIGWALWSAFSGNTAMVSAAIAGAIVLFSVLRAWHNLTRPARVSEIVADELQSRVAVVGLAGRAARFFGVGKQR